MQFSRLRLSGFKSFVDRTELLFEPGLTGIVGPNGCGKSNLVDALRWVMAESSARQVRGREMDDVIFSGTTSRPARNVAEVTVFLDNTERKAPSAFNQFTEIEVSRRIERESGSTYRINGREVRARDVQLLFADAASGARSPALVSQGHIGDVIVARPNDRRALLEEAAGISGLDARRHEAELRLRAAETNLVRLDDVMAALESQLQGLKRQARQAKRYRRLGDQIRRLEATLSMRRWREVLDAVATAEASLSEAEKRVAQLTTQAARASREQAEAGEALPLLREAEVEAAGELHRLEVARVALDAEEARLFDARREIEARLEQLAQDLEREEALGREAAEALSGLDEERTALVKAQKGEDRDHKRALRARDEAAEAVGELEDAFAALAARRAADEAQGTALSREMEELKERRRRLDERIEEVRAERRTVEQEAEDAHALEAGEAAARLNAESARRTLAEYEAARARSQEDEAAARQDFQAAEAALVGLKAEEEALAKVLGSDGTQAWPAVIEAITVERGFETALGAALGDDLLASVDEKAPIHWRALDPGPDPQALPEGAVPLSRFVKGPPALDRRLAQIGVVEAEDGSRLTERLKPGQRLVSRQGHLWRWDGFIASPVAAGVVASRIAQRARLKTLSRDVADTRARHKSARERLEAERASLRRALSAEEEAREAQRRAEAALAEAREARAAVAAREAARSARRTDLAGTADRLAAEREELENRRQATRAALERLSPADDEVADPNALKRALIERRADLAESQRGCDRLLGESAARRERLQVIEREGAFWRHRADAARRRVEELGERRSASGRDLVALREQPARIGERRKALLSELDEAEARRKRAADALAEAESRLAQLSLRARGAEQALAQAREERVRLEGTAGQTHQARDSLAARIKEKFGCDAAALGRETGLDDDAPAPLPHELERRLERLLRERDTMGPVNLRAEAEVAELDEQLATLGSEGADLEAAIGRLRQGIAELNREGRERLLAAFGQIDQHFRSLFTRLFGGGRAHLKLVDSEDPLEAGLEIMASPPGKRLQVMSLLSGGEQALTAIALLFAVFLTNPAPLCVLDEVDAPLDDPNVERFLDLVKELVRGLETRFLIITHHRITMARVDRLFGVTMGERGVSQLVSVDLARAEDLRAAS